jgi:hypothetical protein
LGRSPFEVLYGQKPRHFGIQPPDNLTPLDLQKWLDDRALMQQAIQQHLLQAQQRMKRFADQKRSERTFQVGDQVYLRLQPYIQTSVAQRSSQKLCFRFFGPYKVLQRIGAVAYKLALPATSQVHPVFHVSQLKKALRPTETVSKECLLLTDNQVVIPGRCVQERVIQRGRKLVQQVRVAWHGLPEEFTTWEELNDLHRRFRTAPAWGHAGSLEGGIVTTFLKTQARL